MSVDIQTAHVDGFAVVPVKSGNIARDLDALTRRIRAGDAGVKRKLGRVMAACVLDDAIDFSETERALAVDLLVRLLREMEADLRRQIARRLARKPDAPHELVLALANDEISIAQEVLVHSGVLSDPDLIAIVRQQSREHRLAVALRADLSDDVVDALDDTGEPDVIKALVSNHDVVLSRRALEYIVAESVKHADLQKPLLMRPDLPQDLAVRMFWTVSDCLRETIIERLAGRAIPGDLDECIVAGVKDALRLAQPTSVDMLAGILIARVEQSDALDEEFLIKTLRSGNLSAFMASLARMVNVGIDVVRRAVLDECTKALAVICKVAKLSRAGFVTIYCLTQKFVSSEPYAKPQALAGMLQFFDSIEYEVAETLVSRVRCPA
jgi:uncharacterized protein (DUF2336 family)